jgi:uncharacterized protein involved in type VI secretion and phage assembly
MSNPANEPAIRLDVAGLSHSFEVLDFACSEAISQPFVYELQVLLDDPELDLASLLYRSAYLHLDASGNGVHGQLNELVQLQHGPGLRRCHVRLQPKLSGLSQRNSQRIFSARSVPQILSQVLKEHGLTEEDRRFDLRGEYPLQDFCTQYCESDLQFLQRLCAQANIHYYFEHSRRGHCLVFVEAQASATAAVKPRMPSLQRAWVVEVDEARPDPSTPVAVQFDWVYQGEGATPSHCWLPVSEHVCRDSLLQLTEGADVVVSFIEGDPDRPLITGFLSSPTALRVQCPVDVPAPCANVEGLLQQLRSAQPLLLLCMLPGGGSFNHCAQTLCTCRLAMRLGGGQLP